MDFEQGLAGTAAARRAQAAGHAVETDLARCALSPFFVGAGAAIDGAMQRRPFACVSRIFFAMRRRISSRSRSVAAGARQGASDGDSSNMSMRWTLRRVWPADATRPISPRASRAKSPAPRSRREWSNADRPARCHGGKSAASRERAAKRAFAAPRKTRAGAIAA